MLNADQLLSALWRWRRTFLLTFAAVLGAVAAVTFALPDVYSSTTYLWVTAGRQGGNDYEATQANQVLLKTYAELLQTQGVADEVDAALPPGTGGAKVLDAVEVTPISQSQLIKITAEGPTRRRAQTVADTYARVFLARIGDINAGNGGSSQITLAEPATGKRTPVRPRPKLYLLIGAVLAAFAGAGAALVRQRLDRSLEIDSSTTEVLDLPILARIPQSAVPLSASADGDEAPPGQLSDAFRLLLTNLTFANGAELPRSLAVVSSGPGEGKSTCTTGIGRAAVELDVRTVLVDADLRKPRLSSMFGAGDDGRPGFSNLLMRTAPLAMNEVADRVQGSDLHVIPSGPLPPNPVALLGQQGLARFDQRAGNLFDLVIYDTPPLSLGSDASLVSAVAQATVLVIDSRRTRRSAVVQSVEQLRRSKANVLGVVVNRVADERNEGYYYQYSSRRNGASEAPKATKPHLTEVGARPSAFGRRRA